MQYINAYISKRVRTNSKEMQHMKVFFFTATVALAAIVALAISVIRKASQELRG